MRDLLLRKEETDAKERDPDAEEEDFFHKDKFVDTVKDKVTD
jgi:hypothetical protein